MNIRNLFAIAFASTMLYACSNEEVPGTDQSVTGEETWAAFTIQLPKTVTRAADANATAAETAVNSVAVYVMNDATGMIAASDIVDIADYGTVDNGTNTIKATKVAVKVLKSGASTVWAVLNPTTATHNSIVGNMGMVAFQQAINATVTDMTGGYQYATETGVTAKGFVMASKEPLKKTLVAGITEDQAINGGTSADAVNHFDVQVERAVAKVSATEKAGGVDNKLPLIGAFSDIKYYVRQINPQTYVARWTDAATQPGGFNIVTPDNTNGGTTINTWGSVAMQSAPLAINANATAANELNGIYTLENSMLNPVQQNATYMVVQAKWAPATVYQADGTTVGTLSGSGDFWFTNQKYYMEAPEGLSTEEADAVKWTGGICYYRVYLYDKYTANVPASDGTKYYDVVRNTCYNVTLNSLLAPGSNTDLPKDPTDPTNPGPDPIEEDTWVSVNVDILPWTFAHMDGVDLQ